MFEVDGCSRRTVVRGGGGAAGAVRLTPRFALVGKGCRGKDIVSSCLRIGSALRSLPGTSRPAADGGGEKGSTRGCSRRMVVRGGGAAGAVRLTPRGNSRRQGMSREGFCLVEPPNKFRAAFAARHQPPCCRRGRQRGSTRDSSRRMIVRGGGGGWRRATHSARKLSSARNVEERILSRRASE